MMRSYHIGPPSSGLCLSMSESGLATIAEDVEEDSGGESSGHWMFSGDNTDTDSVIHVPQIPTIVPTTRFASVQDEHVCSSTSSDETLIGSEDEAIMTGNEKLTEINEQLKRRNENEILKKINEKNCVDDASKILIKDSLRSADDKEFHSVHSKDDCMDWSPQKIPEEEFDFSSLETCEEVSLTSELDRSFTKGFRSEQHPKADGVVVFNMSATSSPFSDFVSEKIDTVNKDVDEVEANNQSEEQANNNSYTTNNNNNNNNNSNNNNILEDKRVQSKTSNCLSSPSSVDDEEEEESRGWTPSSSIEEEKNTRCIPAASINGKIKQTRSQRNQNRLRSRASLRHGTSSDGDTDDTDGECEGGSLNRTQMKKSDKAKVLLKIPHQYAPSSIKEGAEKKAELLETSIDALYENDSPQVPFPPDQRDSYEVNDGTSSCVKSVNTLCRDSEVVERNSHFILTENSLEKEKLGKLNPHIRLVRPFSLGDLRFYSSDSDSDSGNEHRSKMRAATDLKLSNNDSKNHNIFSSNRYQDIFLQNRDLKTNNQIRSEDKSCPKPRRHQSMYEPTRNAHLGTWDYTPRAYSHASEMHNKNMRRPKPLSLDMAEEFLSQEGLNSPINNFNPYSENEELKVNIYSPKNDNDMGVANNLAGYRASNSRERGGANISQCVSKDDEADASFKPELTDHSDWRSARLKRCHEVPTAPFYAGAYESQLGASTREDNCEQSPPCSRAAYPPLNSDLVSKIPNQNSEDVTVKTHGSHLGLQFPDSKAEVTTDMSRVHTKTYGTHGEVEVYISRSNNEPIVLSQANKCVESQVKHGGGPRGVTFSPSVKEVNWRESYLEPDDSDYLFTQLEEKQVKKVKVVSNESPVVQKCARPVVTSLPENVLPNCDLSVNIKTSNNVPVIKSESEVKPSDNPQLVSNNISSFNATQNNTNTITSDTNGTTRTSAPIWQRLKLVKIGSPKGPRPKVPPKPPSLSPRTSDNENQNKLSSSPSSVESGISSPSSPEFKIKKIPTSPRFFSWGSKREKKNKTNPTLTTPPSDPPTISSQSPNPHESQVNNTSNKPQVERPSIPSINGKNKEEEREKFRLLVKCKNEIPRDEADNYCDKNSRNGGINASDVSDDFLRTRDSILKQTHTKSIPVPQESNFASQFVQSEQVVSSHPSEHVNGVEDMSSSEGKPPLPPFIHNRNNQQTGNKLRLNNARRQYLTQGKCAPGQDPPSEEKKDVPFIPAINSNIPSSIPFIPYTRVDGQRKSAAERLKERFERFSKATRAERERLARSTPDLSQIEESVRRQCPRIDCIVDSKIQTSFSQLSGSDGDASGLSSNSRGGYITREEVRSPLRSSLRETISPVSAEFDRISQRTRTRSVGLLETDLDTGTSREFHSPKETNLDDLYQDLQNFLDTLPQVSSPYSSSVERTRAKSLLHLDATSECPQAMESSLTTGRVEDSRAKSMEFLLDDDNRAAAKAPENELMKEGERKVSEAELRIRRSLQRLDVPEWMKTATPQQGFILRRKDYTTGTSSGGWSAFSSKTGSMTSLGSSRANTPTKVVIPTRASTRSYGGFTSPASTASISPSPSDRVDRGNLFTYPLSRWSTSRINSGTTTPTGSLSSQKTTSYTRQPYLGWRSNTSLTSLGGSQSSLSGTAYLSPAERLTLTLLQSKQNEAAKQKEAPVVASPQFENSSVNEITTNDTSNVISPKIYSNRAQVADVHSSIKEVTSAIVHYCKETESPKSSPRSSPNTSYRDTSPRRRVWVESSFVGSRPITSPETPTTSSVPLTPPPVNGHQEDLVETRPPQPPEEGSLLNSFGSVGSNNLRFGSKDSTFVSTSESTSVLPDTSRTGSGNSLDDNGKIAVITKHLTSRNSRTSVSENSSRHSTADTINSAISSRGIDSLNSRNSGGSSISRQSSGSRHSSSGRGGSSSREELPDSRGSCEDIIDNNSEEIKTNLQSKNILPLTDESTLTASCHSSFGTFQLEDDTVPLTLERNTRLHLEGIQSINTIDKQAMANSRRFSEGASPWEPTSLFLDRKSDLFKNNWSAEPTQAAQGYGFNFSSNEKPNFLQEESNSEDIGTESTTLEDVLDSLLALPSASRSPSPSSGPHPLSLVRPHTHTTLFRPEENQPTQLSQNSSLNFGSQIDDTQYSYLRNHDLGTDPKTQTYLKSFSYASSTFVPSKSPFLQDNPSSSIENRDSLASCDEERSSVTFYLGQDEVSDNITLMNAKQGFVNHSFTSTPEAESTFFTEHFQTDSFKPPISNSFNLTSYETESGHNIRTSQPLTSFSQAPLSVQKQMDKEKQSNFTNQLGLNSSKLPEEVVGIPSVENRLFEKKNSLTSSAPIKEALDAIVKEPRVTFHLPPKHMNIPPDSLSENGNGTENLRVDIDDDDDMPSSSDPTGMLVNCRNTICNNSASVEEAKLSYKTCHNCSVFYCSRTCRRVHWDKHKKLCEKIKASTVARQVIDKVRKNNDVLVIMSAVARRGILAIGRGAVKIYFSDTASAEAFVGNGSIPEAHYQPLQNIMPQEMGSETYKQLIEQCRNYNPSVKFNLYVSICTFSETPSGCSQKCRRETIAKCAKLRLCDPPLPTILNTGKVSEPHIITRDLNEPETLVLAALGDSNYGLPPRQTREVIFSNIVRELQDRGINLRHHNADVYRKLTHFVDTGGPFPPITIYPKSSRRGNSFMCIIMPEATDPSRLQRVGADGSEVRTIDISRPHPPVT